METIVNATKADVLLLQQIPRSVGYSHITVICTKLDSLIQKLELTPTRLSC